MRYAERNKNSAGMPSCARCGGIHYGSYGCPYENTVCDVCHRTLLQHSGLAFCDGGKTEHDPRQRFCTCLECVESRKRVAEPAPALTPPLEPGEFWITRGDGVQERCRYVGQSITIPSAPAVTSEEGKTK